MDTSNQLDISESSVESILRSNRAFCSKVTFDLSKLKKPAAIFRTYHIPDHEKIIAFSKSTFSFLSLSVDGVIFTNKAFYIHPSAASNLPNNRLAYANLCNYIIAQENDRGSVQLHNSDGQYIIYNATLIFKNTGGKDIYHLLTSVQEEIRTSAPTAKAQFDQQAQWALATARNEINTGTLSSRLRSLLDVLSKMPEYMKESVFIIAEGLFRLCERSQYQKYVDEVSIKLSASEFSELRLAPAKFMETLITQLADLDHEFTNDYLTNAYLNIENDCEKSTSAFSECIDASLVDDPYLMSTEQPKTYYGTRQIWKNMI